jgi:protein-S-isoprenylcysteine O-methyltransferase Ste14
MKKTMSVVYGVAGYVLFLGAFLGLVAFTMNLTPYSVSRPAGMPPVAAAMVNVGLILLFGVQHSVMARPGFKQWWTKIVPPHLERSTFVVIASLLVILIVACWQPLDGELWRVTGPAMYILYGISLLGFLSIPVTSFLTDHFHLFGLRQVFEYAMGRQLSAPVFKERAFYKGVRHPMMLGFLVGFWTTPHMTVSHAMFAGMMTLYILAGIYFEERTLVHEHGNAYRAYQARVPKLLPVRMQTGPGILDTLNPHGFKHERSQT